MSVAIILPARLASTRLPNKLLLDRTGKTVLEHTIARAQEAQAAHPGLFTTIRVACDDHRLIAAARRAGAEAVMTRADHQSGTDRIAEAAESLKEDIVVNLQADEPEIAGDRIRVLAELLVSSPEAECATLATFIFDEATFKNPNVVKVVFSHYSHKALYFTRAASPFPREGDSGFSLTFDRDGAARRVYGYHHIGMYAYRREALLKWVALKPSPLEKVEKLEQLRALEHGFAMKIGIVDRHVPGIDTPEDYEAFVKRMGHG